MSKHTRAEGSRLRTETKLLRDAQLQHSRGGTRLFRNTVGAGFVGPHLYTADGAVVITRPSRVAFGLGAGTSDLVGWKSRIIQPGDVGYRIAQFVAIEGKSPLGRLTQQQRDFLRLAWDSGALAGVARTPEEIEQILEGGPFNGDK